MPSLHCAVAPVALLFAAEFDERDVAAALLFAGLAAGATVVRAGDELVLVRHAARALLNHLVQSVVVELLLLVVFTAPGDDPVAVCAPAERHAGLVALPALVQS